MSFLMRYVAPAAAVVIGYAVLAHAPRLSLQADVKPVRVERCQPIDVAPGSAAIAVDADNGLAFIAASDRRARKYSSTNGIYAIDLANPGQPNFVSATAPAGFRPRGVSLWRGELGEKRLFVINDRSDEPDTVEIFDVGPRGSLLHIDSIAFPAMHAPRRVLGVGPRAFYVTNDRGNASAILLLLERIFALPYSSVAYFDGLEGRYVDRGLRFANGIAISGDAGILYVAEMFGGRIRIYERNVHTGALTRSGLIKVSASPDSIDVSPDGNLLVTDHASSLRLMAHARDARVNAPSRILRLDPKSGSVADAFASIGGELRAASAAVEWRGSLLVGSAYDAHVMMCPKI